MGIRRQMPISLISIVVQIGTADVHLTFLKKSGQLVAKPEGFHPLHLSVEVARHADPEFYSHHLSHSVIYYAVTGQRPPDGDFEYPDFQVDGHDLITLSKTIKTLIEVGEGNTNMNSAPMVIGAGRN